MKQNLLTLGILILFISLSLGQSFDDTYDLNFDNEYGLHHLTIDTISNPNNIWQVGAPQKSLFTAAYSTPNAIVTDTVNPYPVADTSIFIITNVAMGAGFEWPHTVILSVQYYVNSDTLTDYGKIEFSPDSGTTWIDMLNDTVGGWYWDTSAKPVLTGNSNEWKIFWVNLAQLGYFYNVQDGDTILYKFTFISDSIQTNKDGLMFDDFHFEDWVEDIDEVGFDLINSSCYPNPTVDNLTISFENNNNSSFEIFVYDALGKIIYISKTSSNMITLPVNGFKIGTYYYKLVNTKMKEFSIGKFIKK